MKKPPRLDIQRGLRPRFLAREERERGHLRRNRDAEHLECGRRNRKELRERSLQVFQRQTTEGDFPAVQFGILAQKRFRFLFQRIQVESRGIALDFKKIQPVALLVFADQVDLVLSFAIPPGPDLRIAPLLDELLPEVALQRKAGKRLVIPPQDVGQNVKPLQLNQVGVLEDEAKPKRKAKF